MKRICFFVGIWILALMMTSCESMFEKEVPPHDLVGDNAITNETTAEVALNGVYSYLKEDRNFSSTYIIDNEYRLGLFSKGYRSAFEDQLLEGRLTEEIDGVSGPWGTAYKIINAANNFIYNVEKLSDDKFGPGRKTEMLAEAKFMRAFCHAFILRRYGYFWDVNSRLGALIRLNPSSLSNNSMPRMTVGESYQKIFEDYDYAIQYGPQFYSRYHACSTTAKAFKADLLMSRGADGDYAEAARLAGEVLASKEFEMDSVYANIFKAGYESKELLWTRAVDEAPTESDNGGSIFQYFMLGTYQPSDLFYEYFTEEDTRLALTVDSVMTGSGEKAKKTLIWTKHYQQNRDCPMYYMRLAQMVLIKAEALARTDAPVKDVVEVMNVLRKRSKNTLFQTEFFPDRESLLEEIFRENLREIGMENGALFFIAVRMNNGGIRKLQEMNSNYTKEEQMCFPIPKGEMENNFKIEQKPL